MDLSHGLYCSGSMFVGVTVWFGWGGVVSCIRIRVTIGINGHYVDTSVHKTQSLIYIYRLHPLQTLKKNENHKTLGEILVLLGN